MNTYLAIDLGAESGRVMAVHLDGDHLTLSEVYRFANEPVRLPANLHWDVLRLWHDIKQGLAMAVARHSHIASLGVDTWGVDFALLAADDTLLGNPIHYRDTRTQGVLERTLARVPRIDIFAHTGIQFMAINTLYQLVAMVEARSPLLAAADSFLTIPDLFNFWLSGRKVNEFSNATTTQCYDPTTGNWAYGMLAGLDIPTRMFGEIVAPGTVLGTLQPAVAAEIQGRALPVIAPATHDTGSAVAAVPMQDEPAIYLSSGTWSLMGVEVPAPVLSDAALRYNFTNEGGVGGAFRLLKNIMGLWLVQECRRCWAAHGEELSYAELVQMAAAAPAFTGIILPSASRFLAPSDMPTAVVDFLTETGQPVPPNRGALLRTIFESLALEYRWVAERLDELAGRRHPVIHIIGGGAQNQFLNQLTANASGRSVVAGPVEATALGNALVQALALGHIGSLAEGRALIGRSFPATRFDPQHSDRWQAAYARYVQLHSVYAGE